MSDTISLVDELLTRAWRFARMGRLAEARCLGNRLLDQPELTIQIRTEGLRVLAHVELAAGRYRWARRHLVAAISLTPYSDGLYVEYARAVDADPDGDPKKAVKALRRAVSIDPMDVRTWAMLGRMAVAAGNRRVAWKALRRAARLRPDTTRVISEIIEGFLAIGLDREAQQVLTSARFRKPRGVDLQLLNAEFHFDRVVREQEDARHDGLDQMVLPFPNRQHDSKTLAANPIVLRADGPSRSTPHLIRIFGRRIDPRQAR
ncbi:MAG TPA: hypothetical protein VHR66_15730 [Gemmataceae bacterium]|nr:hypothetical protein [Gemmataceae bacterium]